MRVTEMAKFRMLERRINSNHERLQHAVEQIASGQRVLRPSDDPIAAALLQRVEHATARQDAFLTLGQRLTEELQTMEGALESASDALVRARELAMQFANDTIPPELFPAAADEVRHLRDGLVAAANTQFQGRYLFGGVADQAAPFQPDGAFVGSATVRQVEIQSGHFLDQVSGANIFTAAGGVDVFAALDDLEAALVAADTAAVSASLDSLDAANQQILYSHQGLGHQLSTLEQTRNFAEALQLANSAQRSSLVDTDMIAAVERMTTAQAALETVAQVVAKRQEIDILSLL